MRPERFDKERDIVVNVLDCDKDKTLTDAQLAGRTIDVSAAGMKVSMYVALPEKARIALHLDSAARRFDLEGEVRWYRDEGETCVGIQLDEACADYESWLAAFADI